jgi:hypothetical protein
MIVTGFLMLENEGFITLDISPRYDQAKKYPHPYIVEAIIDGKTLVYDCWDLCDWTASDWDNEKWENLESTEVLMSGIDFYFKRSYSDNKNACLSESSRKKIYPLGFNFHVSMKNNPIYQNKFLSSDWCKNTIKKLFFSNRLSKNRDSWTIDKFEASANFVEQKDLKILFLTRLWNPFDKDVWNEEKRIEREYINSSRIEIIEKLKRVYPNNFIGGIDPTGFVNEAAKKHLVSRKFSNRFNYIELMKQCDICIGTMGLHESIGWKTGEYVAASRAIVNEKFRYEIPYFFEPCKNYLPFETPDQCVLAVSELMENPENVFLQKQANETYYKTYLRPDKQISNTLEIVKIKNES